jgi:hypothetical protein
MNIENNIAEKPVNQRRTGYWIIISVLAILTVLYLFSSLSAPVKKIHQLNAAFNDSIRPDLLDKTYPVPENPALFELYRQKAFLESRLAMAKNNTIGLVVDLQDSILDIEIGGIKLHSTQISKYRVSRTFGKIDHKAFIGLFSKPLKTVHNSGTFVKEPIVVKKAPKDTIEAAQQATVPDSIKTGPAFVALTLDYNIRLSLYQENKKSVWTMLYGFIFRSGMRFRRAGEAVQGAVTFRIPDYRPEIRVFVPKKDLITIYRALPADTRVVIKL